MASRSHAARLRPAPSVHTRVFDGELVILDMRGGEYLSLDPIGSRLWSALTVGRSIRETAEEIVGEYDVELEQATADLQALADELVDRGLLVADGDALDR